MKNKLKVVVVDGQGGRLGQIIVDKIIKQKLDCELLAIGTNSIATSSMIKGNNVPGATGENPVVVACRDADIVIGPIGIVAADSLLGEITPTMALAIGQSKAIKLLLPVSHCTNIVVGVKDLSMSEIVDETIEKLKDIILDKQQ